MPSNKVRTRFAPSPTGYMHVGNLRTALYTYLMAKHEGGTFILRIEDTDQGRLVEGATEVIYRTMAECGLTHDEGPDIGGPVAPYIQTERRDTYPRYAKLLVSKGAAYRCFCEKCESEEDSGDFDRGDDPCRDLSPEEVQANYEEKGATVLVLDTADPSEYSDGVILKRGSKRIGVFYVDVPLSEKAAEARVKYFRDCKVDLVVCISSVRTYVRNLQGADIVITLQDEEVSTMGGNSNGSFFVNAPHMDSVGAILVSPSNVVSAKVIESL